MVASRRLVALLVLSSTCARVSSAAKACDASELSAEQRATITKEWTSNGLAEHASVASFSRFSLQLMAIAAPSQLLMEAHKAAIDEVNHAKLAFRLAGTFGGKPVGPGPFPVKTIEIDANKANVLSSVISEGCVAETLSAIRAAQQLDLVTHEQVKSAIATISDDESRHAALAWKTARWLISSGDESIRETASAAFESSLAHNFDAEAGEIDDEDKTLNEFGVLDPVTKYRWDGENKRDILTLFSNSLLYGQAVDIDLESFPPAVASVISKVVTAARL